MVTTPYPFRILVTKIGLDGHDRGSRIVATMLRDAGMEVIYTPPWQSVEDVVQLAIQEDVDVIGISSLATDHLLVPNLMAALKKAGLVEVKVIVGGIIPKAEHQLLYDAGVSEIFGPGASQETIVGKVSELAATAQRAKSQSPLFSQEENP